MWLLLNPGNKRLGFPLFICFYYYLSWEFFHTSVSLSYQVVFHWSLNDSKSSQVSRTFLNAVVGMVLILPLISSSSSPFSRLLGIVSSAHTAIGITLTFMFYSFFSSLTRSRYLVIFTFSLMFTLWSAGMAKSTIWQIIFLSLVLLFYSF